VSVDVLERMFAAFEAGGLEAGLDYIDPDFVAVIGPELSAEPDTYRGHDGIRRYFGAFEGMEDVVFTPETFIEEGERVLVPIVLTGRGAASGIEVQQRVVQAWTVRGGKAVHVEAFVDLESAREAAS
jgi:ketosteroid isomerase-like protein